MYFFMDRPFFQVEKNDRAQSELRSARLPVSQPYFIAFGDKNKGHIMRMGINDARVIIAIANHFADHENVNTAAFSV